MMTMQVIYFHYRIRTSMTKIGFMGLLMPYPKHYKVVVIGLYLHA